MEARGEGGGGPVRCGGVGCCGEAGWVAGEGGGCARRRDGAGGSCEPKVNGDVSVEVTVAAVKVNDAR